MILQITPQDEIRLDLIERTRARIALGIESDETPELRLVVCYE